VNSLTLSIENKESILKTLKDHGKEAQKHAETTLTELDNLNGRLQLGRDELIKIDCEVSLSKRELEIIRTNLKESCALNEIENKALNATRERITVLKQDQTTLENSLIQLKDSSLKEEMKVSNLKSKNSEQLTILRNEIVKFQKEIKLKQTSLDELERQRQLIVSCVLFCCFVFTFCSPFFLFSLRLVGR
jgi:chromosome segregation ATPase